MNPRILAQLCESHDVPVPETEVRFAPPRRWRFDYLWAGWLALEVQGGLFVAGRHSRGAALLKEHEKLNEAACRGFAVLFCTPQQINNGSIFSVIRRALAARPVTV